VKVREALDLLKAIEMLQATPVARNVKFGYFLEHNRRTLEGMQATVRKTLEDPEIDTTIAAFEQDRIAALRDAAKKDEAGNPVLNGNAFVIEDQEAVLEQLTKDLLEKHPGIEDAFQARVKREAEMGDAEAVVELRKLPLALWPDMPEGVAANVVSILYPLIQDEA